MHPWGFVYEILGNQCGGVMEAPLRAHWLSLLLCKTVEYGSICILLMVRILKAEHRMFLLYKINAHCDHLQSICPVCTCCKVTL